MRVLFWTDADFVRSPSARQWFYQMHELLAARGFETSLNKLEQARYDIAIVHWLNNKAVIKQILAHSPQAHVGILNPGFLGFPRRYVKDPGYIWGSARQVAANVDFFLVTSYLWRELLLPYNRRVYLIVDYDSYEDKPVKLHTKCNDLVIGYHGNELHYSQDFFPGGANALRRLAQEYDFTLKVITNNVNSQPRIEGVRTEFLEFDMETFRKQIQGFDIGICPAFSRMAQLADPFVFIRNSNRVNTLLFYGVPSVTSPVPQSSQDLRDGETVLFAVDEAGWYETLKRLITQPELRNKIGHAGREMVVDRFSVQAATDVYVNLLQQELDAPLVPRKGFKTIPLENQIRFIHMFSRRLWHHLPASLTKRKATR